MFLKFLLLSLLASEISAKHVYYFFYIHYICGAPDGIPSCNILAINNQFPGPTIEANIGDTLHVLVFNDIQEGHGTQTTTIHWHGIFQRGTPFQDGPAMVTQCPIAGGSRQEYVFDLKQSGTYWYHSHVYWQYTEGMWGAFIIHNKPEVYADEYSDEITITLTDWYHLSGYENTKKFLSPNNGGGPPAPDSILLNGRGVFTCPANSTTAECDPTKQTPYIFEVYRNKRYRIRVINTSAITSFVFSIEDHMLTVCEVDGVDTVLVNFNNFPLSPAQRASFLVTTNGNKNEYRINADITTSPAIFVSDKDIEDDPSIGATPTKIVSRVQGILRYKEILESDCGSIDIGIGKKKNANLTYGFDLDLPNAEMRFPGEMSLQPHDRILAPAVVDQEIILNIKPVVDTNNVSHLTFNGIVYEPGAEPILAAVLLGRPIQANANAFTTGYNTVVQIIINNPGGRPHPIHLHGHTFFVVGKGGYNESNYDPIRDKGKLVLNGIKRDVITVSGISWVVIRFVTDNPGVWYIHCHINWHLQAGLAAVIIEAPEEAKKTLKIPSETKRICKLIGVEV